MRRILWIVLVLGFGGVVFAAETEEKAPVPKQGSEKAEKPTTKKKNLSGDMARRVDLSRKLAALLQSGNVVDPDILAEQLQREQCAITGLRPVGEATKTTSEIYRDHKESVVVFGTLAVIGKADELGLSCASGFVVSSNGVLATNYHVMFGENFKVVGVMTANGSVYGVREVLAASKTHDLALVRIDAEGLKPVALRADEPVGSDVTVISHPAGRFYSTSRGIISRYSDWFADGEPVKRMEITADFARGSSGGPVFNNRGDVVGMVMATTGIYHTRENGEKENVQMVIKSCMPAESILSLIKTKEASED